MLKSSQKIKVPDDYLKLIREFPLVPIRNDVHLREALKMIDRLSIIDEEKLSEGQADYLLVLSGLVEKYEDDHFPISNAFADGVQALQYLLDQSGMNSSELGRLLGNRQLGSAILRRERQLSKTHVVALAEHFHVSTDLFLRESRKAG